MKKELLLALPVLFSLTSYAAKPEGVWLVTEKSCEGKPATISQDERVQFGDGMYAFIYRLSDSPTKYCNQAQVSTRVIQSNSQSGGNYGEVAVLTPYALRTVCKSKQNNTIISDQTDNVQGIAQPATIMLKADNTGFAVLDKSFACPNGSLHLDLKKQ